MSDEYECMLSYRHSLPLFFVILTYLCRFDFKVKRERCGGGHLRMKNFSSGFKMIKINQGCKMHSELTLI